MSTRCATSSRRIEAMTNENGLGVLAITHYARLLTELRPDRVHVLMGGRIVRAAGPSWPTRSSASATTASPRELGVETLTVEAASPEDPFSDPTIDSNPFADPLA